jgi:uncharacterized membrane protein
MLGWKWTTNEWAGCFLDNKYFFGNYPATGALGWTNKIWHFAFSWILAVHLPLLAKALHIPLTGALLAIVCGQVAFLAGFMYEWIGDCFIQRHGASKLDLIADFMGSELGMVTLLFYAMGGMI